MHNKEIVSCETLNEMTDINGCSIYVTSGFYIVQPEILIKDGNVLLHWLDLARGDIKQPVLNTFDYRVDPETLAITFYEAQFSEKYYEFFELDETATDVRVKEIIVRLTELLGEQ